MQKKLPTTKQFKKLAKEIQVKENIKYSTALENLSKEYGYSSYNVVKPLLKPLFRGQLIGTDLITHNNKPLDLNYDIYFGLYETKKEAENISNRIGASLFIKDNKPCFSLHSFAKNPDYNHDDDFSWEYDYSKKIPLNIFVYEEDVVFKKLTDEKLASLGEPLNATDPDDLEKIKQSLDYDGNGTIDPSYMVSLSDYIDFNYSIKDFIDDAGINFSLQTIAYDSLEV